MDLGTIITGFGGFVGIVLLSANSYHNYKMRQFTKRIAVALEGMKR